MFNQASAPQRIYEISRNQKAKLGAMLVDDYGRQWRYAQVGLTDIAGGTVCQGPAVPTTNTWGRTSVTSSFGDGATKGARRLAGQFGAAAAFPAGAYIDGILAHFTATTGFCIPVIANSAASSSCDIRLSDAIPIAWANGSNRAGISLGVFNGIVLAAATPSRALAGVTQFDVSAGDFCWVLQFGLGMVRRTGALVEGQPVMCSTSAAGTVETWKVSETSVSTPETMTSTPDMPIGRCAEYTSTFTSAALINLNIC